jgi:hypothetical protein
MLPRFDPSSPLPSYLYNDILHRGSSLQVSPTERDHFSRLKSLTQEVARSVGLSGEVFMSCCAVNGSPGIRALNEKQVKVQFHPALLVEKKDLPEQFKLSGLEDKKFTSSYIFELRLWFMSHFGIPEDIVTYKSNGTVTIQYESHTHSFATFYASLQAEPEHYWSVIRFMLTREMLYVKKQKEAPILDFWSTAAPSFLELAKNRDKCRDPFDGVTDSLLGSFVFGNLLCFGAAAVVNAVRTLGPAAIALLLPAIAIVTTIQILFDLHVIYQRTQREKAICREAIALTRDPKAAVLFYKALNQSKWADNFCLTRWIFQPIESYFCYAAENPVDSSLLRI